MIRPILNAEETIKGAKILVNQKPYFLYVEENGKRVKTETVAGYTYECVAIEKQFERFMIQYNLLNIFDIINTNDNFMR